MIFGRQCAHPGTAPVVDDIANSVDDPFVRRIVDDVGHGDEIEGVECFTDPIAITPLRSLLKTFDGFAGENFGVIHAEKLGVNLGVHFSLHVQCCIPMPSGLPQDGIKLQRIGLVFDLVAGRFFAGRRFDLL